MAAAVDEGAVALDEGAPSISELVREIKETSEARVTRLGAFLRKTSLDELPQLFNVLRGT